MKRIAIVVVLVAGLLAAVLLLTHPVRVLLLYAVAPDAPRFGDGDSVVVPGLAEAVSVTQYPDGRFRIAARTETDLYHTVGYLQARDRMFQMDLLRHVAWGRLSEFVGDVAFGLGTSLDSDRFNRFLGLGAQAQAMIDTLDAGQRAPLDAFAAGVNAWIAEERPSVEHRLLEIGVEPWRAVDSLAVFRLLSFGLTHNYTREVRRLLLACAGGIDTVERVWPTGIDFDAVFLPPEDVGDEGFPVPPGIVPEMRAALAELCPPPAAAAAAPRAAAQAAPVESLAFVDLLRQGMSTSNNWVVAGSRTAGGAPLLANDPHLPHMNPPVTWGMHLVLPDREVVGFTLAGLPLVVFGHNFHVAWGATTNNVDLQDLYVEKPVRAESAAFEMDATDYEHDGRSLPFELREETFRVRGGPDVVSTVRFSIHGPLLNDLDPFLKDRIPLTALRSVPVENFGDARAVERAGRARTADELVAALQGYDSACQSWVYADRAGSTGFVSPCRVPVRRGWQGTFPVPGWTSRYEWDGWIAKEDLPSSRDPKRGWLATANNRALPQARFFTTYNSDPSPPDRYLRIAARLEGHATADADDFAALQRDTTAASWPAIRAGALELLCTIPMMGDKGAAQAALCDWDGDFAPESVGATLFVLVENAMLDASLAAHVPGGATGELWSYLQAIAHIETLVSWQWGRDPNDVVWDDPASAPVETRDDVVARAFSVAVATGVARFGRDVATWRWGEIRPFELRHPLGGASAVLAALFNSAPLPGRGAPETVFKNQFLRRDRESMHAGFGPVFRMVVDLGAPRAAQFSLAGGQSGWPRSAHYGDLLEGWMRNEMRPMTPDGPPGAVVRLLPK